MAEQVIKRDINDKSTWAYPNISNGVTVIRKQDVTEAEIYEIYKDCIEIQRNACLRIISQKQKRENLPEETVICV